MNPAQWQQPSHALPEPPHCLASPRPGSPQHALPEPWANHAEGATLLICDALPIRNIAAVETPDSQTSLGCG